MNKQMDEMVKESCEACWRLKPGGDGVKVQTVPDLLKTRTAACWVRRDVGHREVTRGRLLPTTRTLLLDCIPSRYELWLRSSKPRRLSGFRQYCHGN